MARQHVLPHRFQVRAWRRIGIERERRPVTPADRAPHAVIEARRRRRGRRRGRRRRRSGRVRDGGQKHRHPMRWAHDGVVGVRQLARHLELDHVRGEGGAEGGSDTGEDERTGARRILLCLYECLVGLRLGLETVQIHSCQGLSSINVRTQAQDRQAAARCTASARAGQQGQGTARAGQRAAHGYASRSCVGILDSCWRATAAAHLVSNRLLHRVEKKRLRAGCNRHSAQGEGTGQGSDRAGQQVQRTGRMRRACVSGDGVGAYRPWVVYRRGWCTSQKSG